MILLRDKDVATKGAEYASYYLLVNKGRGLVLLDCLSHKGVNKYYIKAGPYWVFSRKGSRNLSTKEWPEVKNYMVKYNLIDRYSTTTRWDYRDREYNLV
jgi:hypothetical protein